MINQSNSIQLDRYDRHILAVLQEDGRISNQDLADRIGLSPSPCLRRVRALEDAGLIRAYRALLDAKKLGLSLMALIGISMDQHTPERFASLEQAITALPEVLECLLITASSPTTSSRWWCATWTTIKICCSTSSPPSPA